MRSFFAQPDPMGVFHYVIDCLDFEELDFEELYEELNMIAVIGTSDPCWVAEP